METPTYVEKWIDMMLENVESVLEGSSLQQSNLIQGVMKFVPVIGNFSNYDGDLRVHLLSGDPLESVYHNNNSKVTIQHASMHKISFVQM